VNVAKEQAQDLLLAVVVQAFKDGLLDDAYSEYEGRNVVKITGKGMDFLKKCAVIAYTLAPKEKP
jgi:hypothetical protein